jgi:hypothetical protein
MEYRMDLVIRWELQFIHGCFRVSPNDFERSNITIEELCILPLFLDFDI